MLPDLSRRQRNREIALIKNSASSLLLQVNSGMAQAFRSTQIQALRYVWE